MPYGEPCADKFVDSPNQRETLLARIGTCAQLQDFQQALKYADEAALTFPNDLAIALRRAVLLRQMHRVGESVSALEKLHSLYPDNPQIMTELAVSHREEGDSAICQGMLEQVLADRPDHRGALLARIGTCTQLQDFRQALKYADEAVLALPNDLAIALRRAVLLRQMHRVDESVSALEQLQSLHPDNPQIMTELAVSHREEGDSVICQALLERVLVDTPDHRGALLARIETYAQLQDFQQALKYADEAALTFPNDLAIALRRAVLLRQMHRVDESVSALEKLNSLHPGNPQIVVNLAISHREKGDSAVCQALFEQVLADSPDHRGALLARIETCAQLQDFQEALKYADEAVLALPNDLALALRRAVLLRQMYRVDESVSVLKKLAIDHPDRLDIKEQLAVSYRLVGDYPESEQLILELLNAPTSNKAVVLRQIAIHLERAEFRIAVRLCEELIQRLPDDLGVQVVYADALSRSHRSAEAVTILDFLETKGVDSTDFANARAMVLLDIGSIDDAINWSKVYVKRHSCDRKVLLNLLNILIFYDRIDDAVDLIVNSSGGGFRFDPGQLLDLVTILLDNSRKSDAEMVLRYVMAPINSAVHPLLPWVLKALGKEEEAKGIALRSIELSAYDPKEISKNLPILNVLGVDTKGMEAQLRSHEEFSASKISKVRDYLLKCFQGKTFPLCPVDRNFLGIAWSFADHSSGLFEDWAARIVRSTNLSILSIEASEHAQETLDFLFDLIDSQNLKILYELHRQGKPFLIATSHFGVPWTLWFLTKHFSNLRYIATYRQPVSVSRFTQKALSPTVDIRSMRQTVALLKQGGVLAATVDSNPESARFLSLPKSATGYLRGRKLAFPSLLPRLAWRENIPIYWLQAKRRNDRIIFDFEPFSGPLSEETQDAWCDRWADAVARKLDGLIGGPPENISLNSPIWKLLAAGECADGASRQ